MATESESPAPRGVVVGLHAQITPDQHRWIKTMALHQPRGKVVHVVRAMVDLVREDPELERRLIQRLEELNQDG